MLQIAQTYLVYFLGDDANHSMPSIRRYVAQEYKQRCVEMETVKKDSTSSKEVTVMTAPKDTTVEVVPPSAKDSNMAVTVSNEYYDHAVNDTDNVNHDHAVNGADTDGINTPAGAPSTENQEVSTAQPNPVLFVSCNKHDTPWHTPTCSPASSPPSASAPPS